MRTQKILTVLVAIAITTLSCEENGINDQENVDISEFVGLEVSIEEVETVVDEFTLYSNGSDIVVTSSKPEETLSDKNYHGPIGRIGYIPDCATVVIETVDEIRTITITFTEDCVDKKGNTLGGMIVSTKEMSDSSKSRTISFTDFTVNEYIVNGTKTYNFTVENNSGNPEMSGTVELTINTEEGTITKSGTRTVEITSGGDTDTHEDNELTITGSHSITKADGSTYNMEITTPLVKPASCKFIASGIKEIERNGEVATLDYGDGTCDNIATLTNADGSVEEIEIRRGKRGKKD